MESQNRTISSGGSESLQEESIYYFLNFITQITKIKNKK